MKDSFPRIALAALAIFLIILAILSAFVQLRVDAATERVCRESCFPFVHRRVAGLCYCYTTSGDLHLADKLEAK